MATTRSNRTTTRARPTSERSGGATIGDAGEEGPLPATRPAGGVSLPNDLAADLVGVMAADVTDELSQAAPTFGNLLSSIGTAIADSQTALDKGLIDTVKELSDTKITVVTDVIQKLDDDGVPVAADTELVKSDLSVLNFFTPTVHEWKTVRVALDLDVGEIDNTQGFTFKRTQHRNSVGGVGMFWGYLGWLDMSDNDSSSRFSSSSRQEVDWSAGQVRVDAMLGPRRTEPFPAATNVTIGPQLSFSQGSVTESTSAGVKTRTLNLQIRVLKADGSANPGKTIDLDPGGLVPSFDPSATTDADGIVKVKLSRTVPVGVPVGGLRARITARLGQLAQSTTVVV